MRFCCKVTQYLCARNYNNECIRDDTKAAARQSLTGIENKYKNKIWRKTIFNIGWNSYTLQCGRWLWYDMQLNLLKRPPYWNSTSGFDFDHITAVDVSFCTSLRNFIQINHPRQKKNYVMSIFKMADLSHLGF